MWKWVAIAAMGLCIVGGLVWLAAYVDGAERCPEGAATVLGVPMCTETTP